MPVPVRSLVVDPSVAATSPKGYTDDQLTAIVSQVPEIYAMLDPGVTPATALALRQSRDPHQRLLGRTYAHLFASTPQSQMLGADLVNGRLEVSRGNHRIRAAERAGVDVLPVEVSARTEAEFDQLAGQFRNVDPARYPRYEQAHACTRTWVRSDSHPLERADRGRARGPQAGR